MAYSKKLKLRARDLRNDMTKEESRLWYDFLRVYPIRFVRQKPIDYYIADFYSPKAHLIIEVDGAQHYDEKSVTYDAARTDFFNKKGIDVLRILNRDINNNFGGVCEYIDYYIKNQKSKSK